ncbi:MAG TPA: hypothetical protein ENJ50_02320, partial [Planctomycetaceae bacterium]|nr:hypothetical protein [Planctomycetaceae bacterium]
MIVRLRKEYGLETRAMLLCFLGIERGQLPCARPPGREDAHLSPRTVDAIVKGKRVQIRSLVEFAKPFAIDYRELIAAFEETDEVRKYHVAPDAAAPCLEIGRASRRYKLL